MNLQSIITVNATRCGGGKTTKDLIPKIQRLINCGERVIVAVPSQELAGDYQRELEHSVMIISDHGPVDSRLQDALMHRENCIIITHAAFLHHIWSRLDRNDYHLILDEVFEPFKILQYKVDKVAEIATSFELVPDMVNGNWWMVTSPPWRDHIAFRESSTYRDLTCPNWWAWQSKQDNENLHAGKLAEFGLELRREYVFDEWISIHIAAAKFEDTFLAYWMKKEGLTWRYTHKFEPHDNADIVWHTFDFKWSRNKRQNNPDLHKQYCDYVNEHSVEPIIAVRNSDMDYKLNNERKVSHNCHGLNQYRDITRISIESSLNFRPEQQTWIQDLLEMDKDQIKRARTTYTLYQVIMRSAIRKQEELTEPIHVYSCDETVTEQLWDYFDPKRADVQIIPNDYRSKAKALTNAERMKIMRFRKNYPEQAHLTADQILNQFTAVRGRPPLTRSND